MRLAETIDRIFGRVEVVLAGAEGALRDGEEALVRGDAMAARRQAHALLARVPGSPLGLALLADACEAGGLDAELALTLQELAARVGSRADVWVRLARAKNATGATSDELRDAYLRALGVAEPGDAARGEALLGLADLDLASGDPTRAELWLERAGTATALAREREAMPTSTSTPNAEAPAAEETKGLAAAIALRKAEARLQLGDATAAQALLATFESDATDARAALVRGRVLAILGDGRAFVQLLRALLLDAPGASEALSSTLAYVPSNEETRARIRGVVEARGEAETARWRAAFARAEGRRDEARRALADAVTAGDRTAARPLLDAALDDRDAAHLALALGAIETSGGPDAVVDDARRLLVALPSPSAATAPETEEQLGARLEACAEIASPRVLPWARALRDDVLQLYVPERSATRWPELLQRLDVHARALHDLAASAGLATLAELRARPIRLAIVGEFNAGKSTFINALLGADVAPTGILPTTATLHHLRYAADPIARIFLDGDGSTTKERIVPLPDLRAVLGTLPADSVDRVEIHSPLPFLTRIEILDTPGFNAPDVRHAQAARRAFSEADVIVWLLDGGQAMKASERAILEEAKLADLPVQFLVNKADRLSPADLARVMDLVTTSIADSGLLSWSPPVALSARLALAGKLGDAQALETSRWTEVQALFDTQLVARADELKERALRRRARALVAGLSAHAETDAHEEAATAAAIEARVKADRLLAAELERDERALAEALAQKLEAAEASWRGEIAMVAAGKSKGTNDRAASAPLARYRTDRALARLAPRLEEGLLALRARSHAASPAEARTLRGLARDVVRTAAALESAASDDAADGFSLALARAAIAALADELASAADQPAHRSSARARGEELRALEAHLARSPAKPLA